VSSTLNGLTFVSNSGDCTTSFPCALGDLPAGASKTIKSTLKAGSGSTGTATATVDSVSGTNAANDTATVNATIGGGCSTGLGPPAPWLAILGLGALVRRRRRGNGETSAS
jgi:MYXO-CTERM domain-containing protein